MKVFFLKLQFTEEGGWDVYVCVLEERWMCTWGEENQTIPPKTKPTNKQSQNLEQRKKSQIEHFSSC